MFSRDGQVNKGRLYAPTQSASWLSPIIVVPKKNGQIHICVHHCKLNAQTVDDPLLPPFRDAILDTVARYEVYSFLDGFSGNNQVRLVPEDQDKTAFITRMFTWPLS